jgi:hypothetical protein
MEDTSMNKESLQATLTEACSQQDGDIYQFEKARSAAALVTAGGELLTIESVVEIQLKGDVVVVATDRDKTFVTTDCMLGVRVGAQPDGTGFLPRR